MDEQTKISDLTVAQFRVLMQQCLDADRRSVQDRKNAECHQAWRQSQSNRPPMIDQQAAVPGYSVLDGLWP